jgi:DNA-binding HxlR family transcriptional regulator
MKRRDLADRVCPVSRAAAQLTDAWTFVVLRELFLGNRRFEGLRLHTGMSPRSLTLRLGQLVAHDIVTRVTPDNASATSEYMLTEKGLDLWPVLVTLRQWGERWAGPWAEDGPPLALEHRGHGHALRAELRCADCGEPVDARSARVVPTAQALRERAAFADSARARTPRRPRRPAPGSGNGTGAG